MSTPRGCPNIEKVAISQETPDELNRVIDSRFSWKKPSGVLHPPAQGVIASDVSGETCDRDRHEFEALRDYVVENFEVVPCDSRLLLAPGAFNELNALLGSSSPTTILVALELRLPVCCEDASLRRLAKTMWDVPGFWSQSILLDMCENGLVSRREYSQTVCSLVLLQYRFVSLQADDLMWALEEHAMSASREVLVLLGDLSGPDCSEESAAIVAAEVVQRLWTRQVPFSQRMLLLDSICMALMRGRANEHVSRARWNRT